jgi:hypothetical protein
MNLTQWKALKKAAGYKVDETLPRHFEIVSTIEAGGTVAPIVWGDENARLIVAAPALLQACKALVAALEGAWAEKSLTAPRYVQCQLGEAAKQADRAIARATGTAWGDALD